MSPPSFCCVWCAQEERDSCLESGAGSILSSRFPQPRTGRHRLPQRLPYTTARIIQRKHTAPAEASSPQITLPYILAAKLTRPEAKPPRRFLGGGAGAVTRSGRGSKPVSGGVGECLSLSFSTPPFPPPPVDFLHASAKRMHNQPQKERKRASAYTERPSDCETPSGAAQNLSERCRGEGRTWWGLRASC
jgi:hypothetical protein